MYSTNFLTALAAASVAVAQSTSYCAGAACFVLNIPAATASSSSGDIYFQISGPTSLSWIGIGQGTSMSGANIFMIYSNAAGNNVTLSPRLGVGETDPSLTSTANAVLLEGSGIQNGMMVANVKCSNCHSWSGGTMNFNASTSNWIYGYKSGAAIASNGTPSLAEHDNAEEFQFNQIEAAGGSSSNPFLTTAGVVSTPVTSSATSGSESADACGGYPCNFDKILKIHAIIGSLAWVLLLPIDSIAICLLSFPGLWLAHAGLMIMSYMFVLASMGMGVWLAVKGDYLGSEHTIIGLFLVSSLVVQPITGLAHHLLYKKHGRPNVGTYPHVWWGRVIITLGIINCGLGQKLASSPRGRMIAYGVVAGVIWTLWMAVILFAYWKSRRAPRGETGHFYFGGKELSSHHSNGHDSPGDNGRRES